MLVETTANTTPIPSTETSDPAITITQHGCHSHEPSSLSGRSPFCKRGISSSGATDRGRSSAPQRGAEQRDAKTCSLNKGEQYAITPGQRVSAYENAAAPLGSRRLGSKVTKRSESTDGGPTLTDCPNEVLTQILSHLGTESQGAIALVSHRFYALITEPHAWRMAFLRYFPGQQALESSRGKAIQKADGSEQVSRARSEFRYFTRLTSLASWRSEYLLRTRLLRSLARGQSGKGSTGVGWSTRSSQTTKKSSAVLMYNSKLPWTVSSAHAVFENAKKGPKVIVGTSHLCVSTMSDPSTGKVDKWGLDDPFAFTQLDDLFPNLEPFGLGDGPAAAYNVVDVSQPYGMIGGEGFPGGRPYYRATNELRGRYLCGADSSINNMGPEFPKIPESLEAICSVWLAKSSAVPSLTHDMVGMMVGSSLGIVTSYAIGHDASGSRYKAGEMTARWALSPGVPIIALKVDEHYSYKRRCLGRIWACAINALAECFVLRTTPSPIVEAVRKDLDATEAAWVAGRSVCWKLIASTRRQARPDDLNRNAVCGAYSPGSTCDTIGLSKDQIIAEARETEKFLRYEPAHFRELCQGWDMRRQLEVDFAAEIILVVRCLQEQNSPAEIIRYKRLSVADDGDFKATASPAAESPIRDSSLFGSVGQAAVGGKVSPTVSATGNMESVPQNAEPDEWRMDKLCLEKLGKAEISSVALDNSLCAELTAFEDPLIDDRELSTRGASTPTSQQTNGEIPGRRARLFGIGTNRGKVVVWNIRDIEVVEPVLAVQTDSPEITSLAISALYVVHGGSDGLVQAWDPLASNLGPIRTLSSKSSGRALRHNVRANPALGLADHVACQVLFLDPDPIALRGIFCMGTFIRYWSYDSAPLSVRRKRRLRYSTGHGRLARCVQGGAVNGFIAAEKAEFHLDQEQQAREAARLRNRFGLGLGDLTEEESVRYAQMMSEEAFLLDEQRRTRTSGTRSTFGMGGKHSTPGSVDMVTPDPSISGPSRFVGKALLFAGNFLAEDEDFEKQTQRAMQLSLLEGEDDTGPSPRAKSPTDLDFSARNNSPHNGNRPTLSSRSASSFPTAFARRKG